MQQWPSWIEGEANIYGLETGELNGLAKFGQSVKISNLYLCQNQLNLHIQQKSAKLDIVIEKTLIICYRNFHHVPKV